MAAKLESCNSLPSSVHTLLVSIHSFIHSGHFYSAHSSPLATTQRRSLLQHGYCIGVSRRSAQATAGKGLAQGPYMAARAGVEPTTLRLKAIDSTKAPSFCDGSNCMLNKNIIIITNRCIYRHYVEKTERAALAPQINFAMSSTTLSQC